MSLIKVATSKSSGNLAGKVLQLLLVCRSELIHRKKVTNFALADMEPMVFVKISLVSHARYRRLRAKELAQSGEQIRCRGRRRINVDSEPEPVPLSLKIAIRSFIGVGKRTGRHALLRRTVDLS